MKKNKQVDKEGYLEGRRTGFLRGYKRGIEDALIIVQDLLEDNGVNMPKSEFYTQMETLKEEGTIKEPHDYE